MFVGSRFNRHVPFEHTQRGDLSDWSYSPLSTKCCIIYCRLKITMRSLRATHQSLDQFHQPQQPEVYGVYGRKSYVSNGFSVFLGKSGLWDSGWYTPTHYYQSGKPIESECNQAHTPDQSVTSALLRCNQGLHSGESEYHRDYQSVGSIPPSVSPPGQRALPSQSFEDSLVARHAMPCIACMPLMARPSLSPQRMVLSLAKLDPRTMDDMPSK